MGSSFKSVEENGHPSKIYKTSPDNSDYMMNHLDTKEVMKKKVGQWYKKKGEGAYIVLDGKQKHTKISFDYDEKQKNDKVRVVNEADADFVKNVLPSGEKSTEFQAIYNSRNRTSQQNQNGAKKDDKFESNSDPNVKSDEAKVKRHIYRNSSTDPTKSRVINSLIKHQNITIENDLKKYDANENSPIAFQDTMKIDIKYPSTSQAIVSADKKESALNFQSCLDYASRISNTEILSKDQIEIVARNNVALLMAWNFIAIAIAVFVSVFCLMFPGSKNWADDKWARARQYSIEFPKLAMQLPSGLKRQGTSATRTWYFPFIWIWRFFTCLGKCTGISLPAWLSNWLNCIFECYRGEDIEKSDQNYVTSDTLYFRQDEFSNGFSKQTPSQDSVKRLHKSANGSSKERISRKESEKTESKTGTKYDSSSIPTLDVKNTLVNKNNSTKSRQTNMHIVHSKSHSRNRIDE